MKRKDTKPKEQNTIEKSKHPGGRPLKYKTVEELQNVIDEYFESCYTYKYDDEGNRIKDTTSGKEIKYLYKPFTVSGLALAIGLTRDNIINNYECKEEFKDAITRAKEMCHNYAEEVLLTGKNPSGAIFSLKNNWGWKDKTETENTTTIKDERELSNLSDAELIEFEKLSEKAQKKAN